MSDAPEYELRWRGRQSGPYGVAEINRMLDEHEIGLGHEIRYQDEWINLEAFLAALQKAAATTAEARPKPASQPAPFAASWTPTPTDRDSTVRIKVSLTPGGATGANEGVPRRRLLFAFLALVGGYLGAHNFYARQWLTGLLQLLLSVATSLMGFGIIASWLWAMAEALLVRRDGHGVEMN